MVEFADVRCVLLDIEGTTSSISFVHDVMFPYVLDHLESCLESHWEQPAFQDAFQLIAQDAGFGDLTAWSEATGVDARIAVEREVRRLMAQDAKATGLKALQGLIWKAGFESAELKAHVFPDVIPAIRSWNSQGLETRIYSSGSVAAQKLFFGHVDGHGNALELFTGHYDTTMGGKKEPASYERILEDWKVEATHVLFVSDVVAELRAAREAGLQTCLSKRPGNTIQDAEPNLPVIQGFDEIGLR